MTTRFVRVLGAAVIGAVVALTAAACTTPSSTPPEHTSTAALPTGKTGGADFGGGRLVVGTGKTVVDTYIDPMCPYCGQFEKANDRALATLVNDGTITLRIHPLDFLDPNSQGTQYSSRASSALTCVAASDPRATLTYLAALYDNQPAEHTAGLSNAKLVSLAHGVGATDADSCITSTKYLEWVSHFTQKALDGPIPGADIPSIQGTPTVLVNGHSYTGGIADTKALKSFIASGGRS